MMQKGIDGRWTIAWKCRIASPPARVFELLATDQGRIRFWCADSVQRGNRIQMTFRSGVVETAEVLLSVAPTRLVLKYFCSHVTFELAAIGSGTDLTVTDVGVPMPDANEVHAGWLNVLFPLKAVCDFDVDLRNNAARCTWADGYLDG